nr:MAG TPA: hypothetical protein [Caudoviricetes sp.]DAN34841.1 MAG TPA: hypothetical protein [Caudoviricetes sp.]DAU36346.1 MAG TPA: hypothetical protein [Caudoviricetes sp.]
MPHTLPQLLMQHLATYSLRTALLPRVIRHRD